MPKRAATIRRVSLQIDELLDAALDSLRGSPVRYPLRSQSHPGERFRMGDTPEARALRLIFEEAIYALEDFRDKHGYIPAQPRFEITVSGEETAKPRRWQRCEEAQALDKLLEGTQQAP